MDKNLQSFLYFVVGLSAGAAVGFFVTKKKYESFMQEEIDSVKDHYKLLRKEGEYSSPDSLLEEYHATEIEEVKALSEDSTVEENQRKIVALEQEIHDKLNKNLGYSQEVSEDMEEENKFGEGSIFDKAEEAERDSESPYHISVEEFMADEPEYDKITVTYFEGDDVLIDDKESIISDVEMVVGSEHFNEFGNKSDSPDIVYVRNERLNSDFEIVRDDRSFSEVVLGVKEEEPQRNRNHKMRDDD